MAALSDYEGWLVEQGDVVVLFLRNDRSLDPPLPQAVSEATGRRTLRFWVFDDEVFGCEAWQGQRFVAEFTAQDPGEYLGLDAEQIEEMDELAAEAGFAGAEATGAAAFVAAVGRGDAAAAVEALQTDGVEHYEMHEALLEALGLPTVGVDANYGLISARPDLYDGPELIALPDETS